MFQSALTPHLERNQPSHLEGDESPHQVLSVPALSPGRLGLCPSHFPQRL